MSFHAAAAHPPYYQSARTGIPISMFRAIIPLTLAVALAGCASTSSAPISLPTAISSVEHALQLGGVTSGDNLDSAAKVVAFDAAVRKEQCSSDNADPTVSILGTVSVSLSGTFTSGGNFSVTNPLTGLGGNISRQSGQTIGANITFMPLNDLADYYLQRQLSALFGLDSKIALPLQRGAVTRHDWLAEHIGSLEASYSDALCQ